MHSTPRRHAVVRPLASLAVLGLVSALAAGCGDDGGDAEAVVTETVTVDSDGNVIDDGPDDTGDDTGDDAGPPLTQEQLELVVLSQENLGDGWTGGPIADDDDGASVGCFEEIIQISDGLDEVEVAEADVEYAYAESGLPTVRSGAVSFEEEAPVAEAFAQFKEVLGSCTSITGTDEDGTEWDVALTYDDTVLSDATDEQINYSATGTITDASGNSFEISAHSSLVRIGRNVIDVATTDFEDRSTEHSQYVEIGIDRFIDVILDSEPDTTVADPPA